MTAAAVRVLELICAPAFLQRVQAVGGYFKDRLEELQQRHGLIKEVRGRGLMIGVELTIPGAKIVEKCLERGFVINCTHDTVLRFVPPLIVEKEEIDQLLQVLDQVLGEDNS